MKDYYERVTNKIIELLDQGVTPWHMPWKLVPQQNPITKSIYSGRNKLLLNAASYTSPYWLTFNEVRDLKGHVKAGERSWPVVWYRWIGGDGDPELPDEHQPGAYPVLRGWSIFNLEQTEGLSFPDPEVQLKDFNPIEKAQQIVDSYQIETRHDSRQAYYSPVKHFIALPPKEHFASETDYYLTRFHEMIHSTGKVLGRKMSTNFHSYDYRFEELVAQIGASYLAEYSGLDAGHFQDTAAYLQSWIGREEFKHILYDNKSMFVLATTKAQQAVNHILGVSYD